MIDDRKRVAILSDSAAFGRALRLRLNGYDVDLLSDPGEVSAEHEGVVLYFTDELDLEGLEEAATSSPTLVVGDTERLLEAVDAGCRGFLPGSASLDEIDEAIATILNGGAVIPPDLLGTLLRHLVRRHRHNRAMAERLDTLTDREQQVFHLAAQGARKEEIGERLFISPATARTHLQRVYRKLGIHSQSELIAMAAQITEPQPRNDP